MAVREGSLEAPTRHPLNWKDPDFYNEDSLNKELERVFDICHGCRRCVSLCHSFPTLFDLVDESETMEVDGVDEKDYMKVVDHCYLCDLCYLTKCPYVPPHEWDLDYPHLMLRAKAVKFKKEGVSKRDKILSSTDTIGKLAGIPVVSGIVNTVNNSKIFRSTLESTLGVHKDAVIPKYHHKQPNTKNLIQPEAQQVKSTKTTTGKVAVFATCYGKYNQPDLVTDMLAVFAHNKIAVTTVAKEQCCGMPKLELGDLEAVERAMQKNIPQLIKLIDEGYDIVAPIPSCVLMFKQELPLMFPDNAEVLRVQQHIFDPFEYLMLRHKDDLLNTDFKQSLGKVLYHAACHQRVQRIGNKTRDTLNLVPDTEVSVIERCSGHDGTYAVKKEFHDISMKICKPVVNKAKKAEANHYGSDCPMAGSHIAHGMDDGSVAEPPISLLRKAYQI